MRCANHLQTEAHGSCTYCGKLYCKECLAEIRGVFFCKKHAVYAFDDQPQYVSPPVPPVVVNNHIHSTTHDHYPYRSRSATTLLCLFLGVLGIHRFYVGKIGTGLIWFFTGGFFLVGWFLDLILIILGLFRDKAGYPLK